MITFLAAVACVSQLPSAYVQVPYDSRIGQDIARRQAYAMPVNPPLRILIIPQTPVSGYVSRITADTVYLEGGSSFRWSAHMSFVPRFPRIGDSVVRQGATVYLEGIEPGPRPL